MLKGRHCSHWILLVLTGAVGLVMLQVVFMGVFLLTRASQPQAGAAAAAPRGSKAHIAYVSDSGAADPQSVAPAAAGLGDEDRWRLSAVRSAHSGEHSADGAEATSSCADMTSCWVCRPPSYRRKVSQLPVTACR